MLVSSNIHAVCFGELHCPFADEDCDIFFLFSSHFFSFSLIFCQTSDMGMGDMTVHNRRNSKHPQKPPLFQSVGVA